jgi:hypothetical protein
LRHQTALLIPSVLELNYGAQGPNRDDRRWQILCRATVLASDREENFKVV